MSRRRQNREDISLLCGHLNDDDLVDPKNFFKPEQNSKENRKAQQLSRQVFETLSYVLSSIDDELLQELLVVAVHPAPDSSRMLVTVNRCSIGREHDDKEVLDRLHLHSGWLRSEIASSITRKRVPTLIFQIQTPNMGDISLE